MAKTKQLNLLFTCVGRRVSLVEAFRKAARQLKMTINIAGTDKTVLSPALQICDTKFIVHPVSHKNYISQLLEIVEKHKIHLIVPTVDLDLKALAHHRKKFDTFGCRVLVSSPSIVNICQDKRKTWGFLEKNDFDSPRTLTVRQALAKKRIQWPWFMKPWDGYASRGTAILHNRKDLLLYAKKIPNPIVQEFIDGTEYTCDVYVDFEMNVRCVVPRKRIEVRSGEVSKAQIVKNAELMQHVAHVVQTLGAGPGVITLQLFLNHDGKSIKVIEINPRFGGGVPLSIKAGANFPKWILQELTGQQPAIRFDGFKDQLTMLRYDKEIWYTPIEDEDSI